MPRRYIKVFHLEHVIYPYRFPLFEELAKRFDLSIYFCKSKKKFRRWDTSIPRNFSFKAEVLKSISLGPITINYALPLRLLFDPHDIYTVAAIDFITIFQVLTALFVAKLFRRPFILCDEYIETSWYSNTYPIKKILNDRLRWILYKYIDAFVVWNMKAAQYMLKQGVPEEKIFTGPHFYPGKQLPEMSISKGNSPFNGKKVVLTVSYLLERKGIDYLIEAFKELRRNDAILVIAGTGQYETKLRALAKDNNHIKFVGYVDGAEKSKYYELADIFVLPTLHDPWGLVVNEAMYFGLPIITTDAASCSDYLVKNNGFIVPAGDKEALKEALTTVLDNDTLRSKMGEESKELIKRCDVFTMMQPFVEAVEYVMKQSANRKSWI